MRRFKRWQCSPELLFGPLIEACEDIPNDAEVVGVSYEPGDGLMEVIFACQEFPELPECSIPPLINDDKRREVK